MRHSRDCDQYEPIHVHCPDHCSPADHEPGPDDMIIAHRHLEGVHDMANPECWCKPFFFSGEEVKGRSPDEIYAKVEELSRLEEKGN